MQKSSHSWLNDRCKELVLAKQVAFGTSHFDDKRDVCSTGLFEEYQKYINHIKRRIHEHKGQAKSWWSLSKCLMSMRGGSVGIPLLNILVGDWVFGPSGKADLFVENSGSKFSLLPGTVNEYTQRIQYASTF